jgi:hypothetical protein
MQESILEDPFFPVFIPPSDAGNLERGAFVGCGERPEGKSKIFPRARRATSPHDIVRPVGSWSMSSPA